MTMQLGEREKSFDFQPLCVVQGSSLSDWIVGLYGRIIPNLDQLVLLMMILINDIDTDQ